VGGASGPGVEPSSLGTVSVNDETGVEIGGDTENASAVANFTVVGTPTTGATLGGKMLECMELLNNNQRNVSYSGTHFELLLSGLESLSIDVCVGARDNRRREDNFPFNDPVILRMRV
jgi:hypothetical protein